MCQSAKNKTKQAPQFVAASSIKAAPLKRQRVNQFFLSDAPSRGKVRLIWRRDYTDPLGRAALIVSPPKKEFYHSSGLLTGTLTHILIASQSNYNSGTETSAAGAFSHRLASSHFTRRASSDEPRVKCRCKTINNNDDVEPLWHPSKCRLCSGHCCFFSCFLSVHSCTLIIHQSICPFGHLSPTSGHVDLSSVSIHPSIIMSIVSNPLFEHPFMCSFTLPSTIPPLFNHPTIRLCPCVA